MPLGDELIKIIATIENKGYLPTNVTQIAVQHGIAKPVVVNLELDKAELLFGNKKTLIGHIQGNDPALSGRSGSTPRNQKKVQWLVKLKGGEASAKLIAVSQKAGTTSKEVPLKSK